MENYVGNGEMAGKQPNLIIRHRFESCNSTALTHRSQTRPSTSRLIFEVKWRAHSGIPVTGKVGYPR
jgi:hypothetical protein